VQACQQFYHSATLDAMPFSFYLLKTETMATLYVSGKYFNNFLQKQQCTPVGFVFP